MFVYILHHYKTWPRPTPLNAEAMAPLFFDQAMQSMLIDRTELRLACSSRLVETRQSLPERSKSKSNSWSVCARDQSGDRHVNMQGCVYTHTLAQREGQHQSIWPICLQSLSSVAQQKCVCQRHSLQSPEKNAAVCLWLRSGLTSASGCSRQHWLHSDSLLGAEHKSQITFYSVHTFHQSNTSYSALLMTKVSSCE